MGSSRRALALAACTLLLAGAAAGQSVHAAAYIIWGAGPDYPKPEPGFELASLADVKTPAFVEYYNANGFTDIQQNLNGCCVFRLKDGYLVIGSTGSYTYLAPYTAGGAHQCSANLQSPVYFGGAYGVGPRQGQYIGKLTPTDVAELGVVPTLVTQLGCGGLQNTFGIYRKVTAPTPPPPPTPPPTPSGPPYVVYGAGQAFPTPPPGYTMMSFRDVVSSAFIDYYNANYLTDLQQDMLGCCVFNTTDGYVTVGAPGNFSYLGPYTAGGQFQCRTQLTNPVAFGGEAVVGPYALHFIGKLTPGLVAKLSYNPTLVDGLCQGTVNSFGLYRAASAPTPPPPTPSGPPYVVYGAGQAFPTPPAGYRLMTFREFNTPDFIDYYNANYLPSVDESLSGCCVFNTTDGYVTVGDPGNFSYLGPYTAGGQFQCVPTLQSPVAFGGEAVVGPYALHFIGKLTPGLVAKLSYNPTLVDGLCQGTVNSFGLYIRAGLEVPHRRT